MLNHPNLKVTKEKTNLFKQKLIFQMAKRLKLDLGKFGYFDNHNEKILETSLTDFIVALYERRFRKIVII